jgi:hypothetical protein
MGKGYTISLVLPNSSGSEPNPEAEFLCRYELLGMHEPRSRCLSWRQLFAPGHRA